MKELSIEEKAKRYDEAIERAKSLLSGNQLGNAWIYKLLPELKELGEDERIRKGLLYVIEHHPTLPTEEAEEYIAWLEKQGEHAKFYDSIQVGDKVTRNEDGVLVNLSQLKRVAKKDEKQCEQKSADKVEPKFHEGEWIVKNDDSPINIDYSHCKITKVENGNYTIESIYGYKGYNTFETFEKDYHLWTIQDAKDGDVLVGGEQLFLFKRINTSNSFYAYCNYHFIGYDSLSIYDCSYSIDNIHLATKEQRDLLFKKMKESGYMWDAEKKELKKIEKKFNEWSEEDEKMLKACTELVGSTICANYGEEDGVTIESCRNWLKSLKPQNWTKEDKERYTSCLQRLSTGNPEQSETINSKWFKEHVYPQSQWKPSEEQIKALSYYLKNDIDNDGVFGCQLVKLYQDLKKLREE